MNPRAGPGTAHEGANAAPAPLRPFSPSHLVLPRARGQGTGAGGEECGFEAPIEERRAYAIASEASRAARRGADENGLDRKNPQRSLQTNRGLAGPLWPLGPVSRVVCPEGRAPLRLTASIAKA